ncbi:MAG: restriction endonuclease subunit S [Nevskiales bacterium]|nr:restriction endonuclease subunit S [Nevskiales bacterium]
MYLRYSVELGKMLDTSKITGEYLTPYLRNVDVQWGRVNLKDLPSMDISPSEHERFTVREGDLLVCEGGEVGRAAVVRYLPTPVGFQKALHRLRASSADESPHYMFHVFRWATSAGAFAGEGQSTIAHLTGEQLRKYRFPKPSVEEQTAIAAFLDRETAKIDALVAEQEKLIALLKEKRQAVISHAVTKGLNPDAPMKPSGIEWLGDVPAHWEVTRLAALFREASDVGREDLPILSVSIHDGVSDKELDADEMDRKVTRSEDRSKYKAVHPGDLAYNMMRAWQGGFGAVTVAGQVSPAYVVARPIREVITPFIEQVLRAPRAVEEMRRHSRGITDFRLRLYWEEFKNIVVALPDVTEQEHILATIAAQTDRFSGLVSEAERAINLLKERRSALTSAAVTGQIDVRETVEAQAA